jgi:hypothetical protein
MMLVVKEGVGQAPVPPAPFRGKISEISFSLEVAEWGPSRQMAELKGLILGLAT